MSVRDSVLEVEKVVESENSGAAAQAEAPVVAVDQVVSFHYRLREVRPEGNVSEWLESSFDSQPLLYLHGYRNVVSGLESALVGKKVGETVTVVLKPEQAYGHRRSNAALRVPVKHLRRVKHPRKLMPGAMVSVDTEQGVKNALVVKVGKFHVDLDTNHPFAGRTLEYEVEIVDIRPATAEEIAHRHAHGPGGHHHD
jgi:FKBP-type peptidyl-prolyl cis-trans isomerase 2